MEIDYQIISVFTDQNRGFTGNPAAVILLDKLPAEKDMQNIAKELNQPATTFLVEEPGDDRFAIRWFAPDAEIGLCGHGTAAATAFLGQKKSGERTFTFIYPEGKLEGKLHADQTISIITQSIEVLDEVKEIPEQIVEGLGIPLLAMYRTENKYIILAKDGEDIKKMNPDFERLSQCEVFGYAVTAQGADVDFISRTLVPHTLQKEDYATGSSHAMLVPFWAKRFEKNHLQSLQLSKRGGAFSCELDDNGLVTLSGAFLMERAGRISL
ncbi:PhzF family phenazine biosynthesis protein [Echinicola soli]|uniref:PhzF family phenazine biosynthesis protein n=1 Tax=Echinicola soli TaxID=2591634 RepID=A0A514CK11_9BACT|nr:PhzF family phenazine biosynthesis isomerase [Echinicola soli]QDH80136.1 PhzF family phenazine biosynthesis protein [Echinicola soli]